jgi:hypothetical protein
MIHNNDRSTSSTPATTTQGRRPRPFLRPTGTDHPAQPAPVRLATATQRPIRGFAQIKSEAERALRAQLRESQGNVSGALDLHQRAQRLAQEASNSEFEERIDHLAFVMECNRDYQRVVSRYRSARLRGEAMAHMVYFVETSAELYGVVQQELAKADLLVRETEVELARCRDDLLRIQAEIELGMKNPRRLFDLVLEADRRTA